MNNPKASDALIGQAFEAIFPAPMSNIDRRIKIITLAGPYFSPLCKQTEQQLAIDLLCGLRGEWVPLHRGFFGRVADSWYALKTEWRRAFWYRPCGIIDSPEKRCRNCIRSSAE